MADVDGEHAGVSGPSLNEGRPHTAIWLMPSFKLHTQEQKKLKGLGRVSEKPRAFSKVTFDISKALSKHILIKDRKNCKSYPSQVIIYQVYISGMTCLVPSVPSVLSVLRVPSVLSVWSNVRSIQPTAWFFFTVELS